MEKSNPRIVYQNNTERLVLCPKKSGNVLVVETVGRDCMGNDSWHEIFHTEFVTRVLREAVMSLDEDVRSVSKDVKELTHSASLNRHVSLDRDVDLSEWKSMFIKLIDSFVNERADSWNESPCVEKRTAEKWKVLFDAFVDEKTKS